MSLAGPDPPADLRTKPVAWPAQRHGLRTALNPCASGTIAAPPSCAHRYEPPMVPDLIPGDMVSSLAPDYISRLAQGSPTLAGGMVQGRVQLLGILFQSQKSRCISVDSLMTYRFKSLPHMPSPPVRASILIRIRSEPRNDQLCASPRHLRIADWTHSSASVGHTYMT